MKELLEFVIKGILGDDTKFAIEEIAEDDRVTFNISLDPEKIGLLVGKGGKTIKSIQAILSVRARLENKIARLAVS